MAFPPSRTDDVAKQGTGHDKHEGEGLVHGGAFSRYDLARLIYGGYLQRITKT